MKISSIAIATIIAGIFVISANGQDQGDTKVSVLKASNGKQSMLCSYIVLDSMRHLLSSATCAPPASAKTLFGIV
jgi:hypothetical protein